MSTFVNSRKGRVRQRMQQQQLDAKLNSRRTGTRGVSRLLGPGGRPSTSLSAVGSGSSSRNNLFSFLCARPTQTPPPHPPLRARFAVRAATTTYWWLRLVQTINGRHHPPRLVFPRRKSAEAHRMAPQDAPGYRLHRALSNLNSRMKSCMRISVDSIQSTRSYQTLLSEMFNRSLIRFDSWSRRIRVYNRFR